MSESPFSTLIMRATVHHGDHRATVAASIDDYKASEDDLLGQIAERLEQIHNGDDGNEVGTYVPTSPDTVRAIGLDLLDNGAAEHGWVRYTLEEI